MKEEKKKKNHWHIYRTGKLYGEETDGACRRKKFDGFWNGKKQCEDLCAIQ